jgi:hypothetical protein
LSRHKLTGLFQNSKSVYRIPRRALCDWKKSALANRSLQSVFSPLLLGVSTMNTKLALSALVAALMLTACAKQEAAAPEAAPAATPPAAEAPAAAPDAAATPPADGAAPAAPAAGDAAAPPAEAPKQ